MEKQRPYRVIKGIAYPHLIKGKSKTRIVEANLNDRNEYYYDEAIRLSEEDVTSFNHLKGHPICVEHDRSLEVGTITHSWTDQDGKLRFMGRVFLDTKAGRMADKAIANGELRGISVGYDSELNHDMEVVSKNFYEISLCREGFFPGAKISVAANKLGTDNYNSAPKNGIVYYKIMASQDNTEALEEQAAPVAAPAATEKTTDISEMARQTDDILKKNEKLAAELKAEREARLRREERLAELEAKELKRQEEYEKAQAEKLKEVLEINRQQYKDVHGDNAELPAEYEKSAAIAFKNEGAAPQMMAITASALAYSQQKKAHQELLDRYNKLEEMVKKATDENKLAMAHVNANRRRIFTEEPKTLTEETEKVPVSASTSTFEMMFVPQPSKEDLKTFERDYGGYREPLNAGVQASGSTGAQGRTFMRAPVHAHMDKVQNGMRAQGFEHIFAHMIQCDPMQVRVGMQTSLNVDGQEMGKN